MSCKYRKKLVYAVSFLIILAFCITLNVNDFTLSTCKIKLPEQQYTFILRNHWAFILKKISSGFLKENVKCVILYPVVRYFVDKVFSMEYKGNKYLIAFFSGLISSLYVLGYSFSMQNNWNLVFGDIANRVLSFLVWIGFALLLYLVMKYFLIKLENVQLISEEEDKKFFFEKRWTKHQRIIGKAIILFLCWVPYMIILYPCSASFDTKDQMAQIKNIFANSWSSHYVKLLWPSETIMNNHHPFAHTMIIKGTMAVGKFLGSYNIGFFLLVIIQGIALALTLSYVIEWLHQKKCAKKMCNIIFLVFCISPIYGLFVTQVFKDTWFTIALIWVCVLCYDMVMETGNFFSHKLNMILFVITSIFMGLMRNNGLYMLVMSAPIIIISLKKYWKKTLLVFLIPIIFLGIVYPKIILPACKVSPGSYREMLSIPTQQTARYLIKHKKSIQKNEKDMLKKMYVDNKLLDKISDVDNNLLDKISDVYNPRLSDPVRLRFNINASKNTQHEYWKFWLKGLKKDPLTYIQATLNNTYQFFYPDTSNALYFNGITWRGKNISFYGLENPNSLEFERNILQNSFRMFQSIPLVNAIMNMGFYMWIFLFICCYCINSKKCKILLPFSMAIVNMIICFAGPIASTRYGYYLIILVPIMLVLCSKKEIQNIY
ncbi:MAG: DUF6020 family protein [Anaerostipes sp.]|nr:DUF6020 family protein [Anaerostipes sp.]